MKRSERIKQRIKEIENSIYYNLHGGQRRMVNKGYRMKKQLEPKYRKHASKGKNMIIQRGLQILEGPPKKKKRVVGEK